MISTDDGVRLAYDDSCDDSGDGPPVVLIAGFTPTGHTMARHGRDLDNFLAALDLREAVLIGGSQGASTIWSYVRQFGTPRIRAAIAVDQTPRMLNSDDWPFGFYGYTEGNRDTYFAEGIPRTGHEPPRSPEVGLRMLQALSRPGSDPTKRPPLSPTDLELLHDHAIQDWRPEIAGMAVPMLLVAARQSDFWPYEHAAAAGAQSAIMENVGHAANLEDTDQFNEIMLNFLGSNAPTA